MKILCEFTAYYPGNEGVNGGYYDALGNLLNPDELTCADLVAFHFILSWELWEQRNNGWKDIYIIC